LELYYVESNTAKRKYTDIISEPMHLQTNITLLNVMAECLALYFVFRRSWVQISYQRLPIMSISVVFFSPSWKMLG
jgi:hypothetical protein